MSSSKNLLNSTIMRAKERRNKTHRHTRQGRFVWPWSSGQGREVLSHFLTYRTHQIYPESDRKKDKKNELWCRKLEQSVQNIHSDASLTPYVGSSPLGTLSMPTLWSAAFFSLQPERWKCRNRTRPHKLAVTTTASKDTVIQSSGWVGSGGCVVGPATGHKHRGEH